MLNLFSHYAEGYPLTAPHAQSGNTFIQPVTLHMMNQRNQNAATGSADCVPQRDRAAMRIDPLRIDAMLLSQWIKFF